MKSLSIFLIVLAIVGGLSVQGHATLTNLGQDSQGHNLIYDSALNITWYDFTHLATNDNNYWDQQNAWATTMTVNFGGKDYSGWRLPTAPEMNYLYFTELEGSIFQSDGVTIKEPFKDLHPWPYFSGTKYYNQNHSQWEPWYFHLGQQYQGFTESQMYALAVHDGPVSAVPIPAAVWLLGSGLIGLIGARRFRR